jgi:hypothetical protein
MDEPLLEIDQHGDETLNTEATHSLPPGLIHESPQTLNETRTTFDKCWLGP